MYDNSTIKDCLKVLIKEANNDKELLDLLKEIIKITKSKQINKKKRNILEIPFNPFAVFSEKGVDLLRKELSGLENQYLYAIIKKYGFDPSRISVKWNDKGKLIDLIIKRIEDSLTRGDVFRK